ncbi:hypothetical protein [Paraburkholderia aspalathi]|uniref:hypothetical protein n=1 Tax=Paraburkholderia aspalathi TaxID=1324617 RepID=UPI0038BB8B22
MSNIDGGISREFHAARRRRVQRQRYTALITITAPAFASLGALTLALAGVVVPETVDVVTLILGYCITMLGITVGFHRLYTHRSFDCGAVLRFLFGVAGSMAAQGPVMFWVSSHRRHHRFADSAGDPHTPLVNNVSGSARPFPHADFSKA